MIEGAPTTGRSAWLPSIGAYLWLALFLGLTLSPWRVALISRDGDAALHWKIGDWMIRHRAIIRVDDFSYTKPGAPMISKEWLAEVIFAAAGNLSGWNGIVLLSAALIATTLWLLYRQATREGCDRVVAALGVLLAAYGCQLHWLARPHLITHLLLVLFTIRLRDFERGRLDGWSLAFWLVPLMALWANLHGAFPYGLVLIGGYAAGAALDAWNGRRDPVAWRVCGRRLVVLISVSAGGALATLLNPNGWRLHAIILTYLRDPTFISGVNEFLPPNFHNDATNGFTAGLLVLALLLLVVRPRLHGSDLVLLAGWGYAGLQSLRNLPVFALVATPIYIEHVTAWLANERVGASRWGCWFRGLADRVAGRDVAAGGCGLLALAVLGVVIATRLPHRQPALLTKIDPKGFPVAAVEFLRAHPDAVGARMFNTDSWGGYLMLELPERKLFMDSRHEFYGAAFIHDYKQTVAVTTNWPVALDKYAVNWTLLPADQPLNRVLAIHPQWESVYADETTAIFRRKP